MLHSDYKMAWVDNKEDVLFTIYFVLVLARTFSIRKRSITSTLCFSGEGIMTIEPSKHEGQYPDRVPFKSEEDVYEVVFDRYSNFSPF